MPSIRSFMRDDSSGILQLTFTMYEYLSLSAFVHDLCRRFLLPQMTLLFVFFRDRPLDLLDEVVRKEVDLLLNRLVWVDAIVLGYERELIRTLEAFHGFLY